MEAAGLVLSIIPVVVGTINWWEGRSRGRDMQHLAESLENNRHIFLNSIETLLRSALPAAQVQILLHDPVGDAWRDPILEQQVIDVLGNDGRDILGKVTHIYKTLLKLQKKLPQRGDPAIIDENRITRVKLVIKCFVHAPYYKTSLDSLRISITEFRKLVHDAIRLAPARNVIPGALQKLSLFTECASRLHDAVRNGWQCDCNHFHPANIKLDTWSLPRTKRAQVEEEDMRFRFSFLFAPSAHCAHSDQWITAEVTPPSDNTYPPHLSDQRSLDTNLARSISFRSDATTLNATSMDPSSSMPSTVQGDLSSERVGDIISDLCSLLKDPPPKPSTIRRKLGLISNSKTPVVLFNEPEQLHNVPTRRSVKLSEVLIHHTKLSMKSRMQISSMLAWGVLQMSSTAWMNGKWTKDNILLVTDSTNDPLPYVTHSFQSQRQSTQKTTTLDPEATNHIGDWIRSASLFALGVFLLEMCYGRSIEDLAVDDEKNKGAHTQFLTATRLAINVHDQMGQHYSQAVNACINQSGVDVDADGNPKDPSQFAKSILNDIIEPLKTCTDRIFPTK